MGNIEASLPYKINEDCEIYISLNNLWTIKKCTYNNQINATLFLSNNNKSSTSNDLIQYPLNQIKFIKTLRHPNILKYIYSHETSQINNLLLISEDVKPLDVEIKQFNYDQIIHGLYGITSAIDFLHNKAFVSHNNICESNIYVNTKSIWKLSGFEYSLCFTSLNKENLSRIKQFKYKNCITPEEENDDSLQITKNTYHSIDVYCWAIMFINILDDNGGKLIDKMDDYEQFQLFLDKSPKMRPTINQALKLNLFKSYHFQPLNEFKYINTSNHVNGDDINGKMPTSTDNNEFNLLNTIKELIETNESNSKIDEYIKQISTYLYDEYIINENRVINEHLIDYLLSPIMFFNEKTRNFILPYVLIPNTDANSDAIELFFKYKLYSKLNITSNINNNTLLKPFINEDKYKIYVLPRILNLFSMRSLPIRLVLLEYFPFYIYLINNNDTLKYELLPELLLGLKEENDQLASLTFLCLSTMVNMLGNQIVVGNSKSKTNKKFFSNNLPKVINYHQSNNNNNTPPIIRAPESQNRRNDKKFSLIHSDYNDDDIGEVTEHESIFEGMSDRYLDDENNQNKDSNKKKSSSYTSDSMIALNEFQLSNDEQQQQPPQQQQQTLAQLQPPPPQLQQQQSQPFQPTQSQAHFQQFTKSVNDFWSNDFDWNDDQQNNLDEVKLNAVSSSGNLNNTNQIKQPMLKLNDSDLGAEYDIKSINLKGSKNDADDFFSDMQPVIKTTKAHLIDEINTPTTANITQNNNNNNVALKDDKVISNKFAFNHTNGSLNNEINTISSWNDDDIQLEIDDDDDQQESANNK